MVAPLWFEHVTSQTIFTPLIFVFIKIEAPVDGYFAWVRENSGDEGPKKHKEKEMIEYQINYCFKVRFWLKNDPEQNHLYKIKEQNDTNNEDYKDLWTFSSELIHSNIIQQLLMLTNSKIGSSGDIHKHPFNQKDFQQYFLQHKQMQSTINQLTNNLQQSKKQSLLQIQQFKQLKHTLQITNHTNKCLNKKLYHIIAQNNQLKQHLNQVLKQKKNITKRWQESTKRNLIEVKKGKENKEEKQKWEEDKKELQAWKNKWKKKVQEVKILRQNEAKLKYHLIVTKEKAQYIQSAYIQLMNMQETQQKNQHSAIILQSQEEDEEFDLHISVNKQSQTEIQLATIQQYTQSKNIEFQEVIKLIIKGKKEFAIQKLKILQKQFNQLQEMYNKLILEYYLAAQNRKY